MPRDDDEEENVATLQRRVADLESELKKCKKGMSAAAKKFKVQERELGDAERLCRERKRAVKSLTAQLEKAGGSDNAAGGGGGASGRNSARKIDSIISTGFVQFALSQMFSVVQDELRLQDAEKFRRIESLPKFQSAALQVMKTSLKNLAGPLVDKLRTYAKENLPAGVGGLSDSDSDSGGGGGGGDDIDDTFGGASLSPSPSSQPGPTSNPTSTSTSHTASPINSSRGTNAARLPYFPLVETQRGACAKHVRVALSGQDYSRFPLTFTITCISPLRGPAGASGSRRAKASSSALDALPPVSRTIADFEQLAEYLKREFPRLHVPVCLVHTDASGLARVTGAAQQNASAEKQARDAEYQLQLWLEHIMAHPLFASVDAVAALRDFLTRKGAFLASAVAQYNTSDIVYPPSVVHSTITASELESARTRAASASEHVATLVSRFTTLETKLRLKSAREFGFARLLADASDAELVETPKLFPHAPTWLHGRTAVVTGKILDLLRKVQTSAGHEKAEALFQFVETVAVPRLLFVGGALLPEASSILAKDRRRSQASLQEWDHTRAQAFRGQAGEGLVPTLASLANQQRDAAADSAKLWAECADRLRQIRKKMGFQVLQVDTSGSGGNRSRLDSIDVSGNVLHSWGAKSTSQALGQVYAYKIVRTSYSWHQHAEYRVLVRPPGNEGADSPNGAEKTSTFSKLHDKLKSMYSPRRTSDTDIEGSTPFAAIPDLVNQRTLRRSLDPRFLQERQEVLNNFLRAVLSHRTLAQSAPCVEFLCDTRDQLQTLQGAMDDLPTRPVAQASFRRRPANGSSSSMNSGTGGTTSAGNTSSSKPPLVRQSSKSRSSRRNRASSSQMKRQVGEGDEVNGGHDSNQRSQPLKSSGGRRRRSDPPPHDRHRSAATRDAAGTLGAAEPLLHRATIPKEKRRASLRRGGPLRREPPNLGTGKRRSSRSGSTRRGIMHADEQEERAKSGLKKVPTAPIVKDFWDEAGPEDHETGLKSHRLKKSSKHRSKKHSKKGSRRSKKVKEHRDQQGPRSQPVAAAAAAAAGAGAGAGTDGGDLMEEIRGGAKLKKSRSKKPAKKASGKKYRRSTKQPAAPAAPVAATVKPPPPTKPKAKKVAAANPGAMPKGDDEDDDDDDDEAEFSAPSIDGDSSDEDENENEVASSSSNRGRAETLGFGDVISEVFQGDGWIKAQSPDGREYYYHEVTRKVSWEYPDERTRAEVNALSAKIRRNQARAQSELSRQRADAAQAEKEAFSMDAELNRKLKAWRGKKNIVDILNTLGEIVPKCAPNFSVAARPSPAELRKARKKVFLKLHPDKIPSSATLAEKLMAKKVFSLVNDVYNRLPDHMK